MADKPGPKPTQVDDMVGAIREAEKPAVTVGDIAEVLDVSPETIRRRRDELESHPDVHSSKIGRATAYWLESEPPSEPEFATEPGSPVESTVDNAKEQGETQENREKSLIRRLFTGSNDGMPVPGIALVLLGIVLPLIALRRLTDGAIERLTAASDVYANQPDTVRYPRFGSPPGVWIMTFLAGMLGLTAGVAVGILVLDPLPVVAQYAVTALLSFGLIGIAVGGWHYWNTKPGVKEVGQHEPVEELS